MTEKDRLIELLKDALHEWECDVQDETLTEIADHLVSNGVIVPPPGVKPCVRAVRERICNQFFVTKETRIQWSEQTVLVSEEEAERVAYEFVSGRERSGT